VTWKQVCEPLHLLAHRGHHLGVAVPRVENSDATREVDVALAFDVPDLSVARACSEDPCRMADAPDDRQIAARQPFGVPRRFGF
jgi:hypothetical protein